MDITFVAQKLIMGSELYDVSAFIIVWQFFLSIKTLTIIQCNIFGLGENFEVLRFFVFFLFFCCFESAYFSDSRRAGMHFFGHQHISSIVGVQECQRHENKVVNLNVCFWHNKSSSGNSVTGGIPIYISKLLLFSKMILDTNLQTVAVTPSGLFCPHR